MTKLDFLTRFAVDGVHYNLSEVMDDMVNSDNSVIRLVASYEDRLTQEQITKLVNDENHNVRRRIVVNPNLTKEHLNQLMNDENPQVRDLAYTIYYKNRE